MRQAQAGIENLKEQVDSLIVILNDKLEEEVGDNATMSSVLPLPTTCSTRLVTVLPKSSTRRA